MNLLIISGSLRAASSNTRALEAVRLLAPAGWIVRPAAIDSLPFFNPDVESAGLPDAAARWRADIAWSDALVISSPEYAHGVPGVLKNALDWLVGGTEISDKPVALFNATPPAEFAHASLRETLRVMGALVSEAASIELPLRGRAIDAPGIAADAVMSANILGACAALSAAVRVSSESGRQPTWDTSSNQ